MKLMWIKIMMTITVWTLDSEDRWTFVHMKEDAIASTGISKVLIVPISLLVSFIWSDEMTPRSAAECMVSMNANPATNFNAKIAYFFHSDTSSESPKSISLVFISPAPLML